MRGVAACESLSRRLGMHLLLPGEQTRSGLRRSCRAEAVRSRRGRPRAHRALLDAEGSAIAVHELVGEEGFATTERLVRLVLEDQAPARWQILDLRRVTRVDTAALTLLTGLTRCRDAVVSVLVEPRSPAARSHLRELPDQVVRFGELDGALESCETQLLETHGCADELPEGLVAVGAQDLLQGLSPAAVDSIETRTTTKVFTPGSVVFDQDEPADGLYFLSAGQVSAEVRTRHGRGWRRLNTIMAGASFGELALVDGQPRSTRIVALEPTICHILTPAAYGELQEAEPTAWAQLTLAIARSLSQRLRSSTVDVAAFDAS
ncbi:MAG TPA: cyclic nucleotide-binding domain-containing protein [Actinomycetes bacterium]